MWTWVNVGFDDGGSWVLTMVEISGAKVAVAL